MKNKYIKNSLSLLLSFSYREVEISLDIIIKIIIFLYLLVWRVPSCCRIIGTWRGCIGLCLSYKLEWSIRSKLKPEYGSLWTGWFHDPSHWYYAIDRKYLFLQYFIYACTISIILIIIELWLNFYWNSNNNSIRNWNEKLFLIVFLIRLLGPRKYHSIFMSQYWRKLRLKL